MQNLSFENYCKQERIVLETAQNISEFISNLFQKNNLLFKHFQDNIWHYNLALTFILLKYIPDLKLLAKVVSNFQIHGKLYYMQRHINDELHDNNLSNYIWLYLYNLAFAIEQSIT